MTVATQARESAVMEARDLRRHFQVGGGLFAKPRTVKAVEGVSFTLKVGETLAIVGESGCGKSTLARMATLLDSPTSGELLIDGNPTLGVPAAERRKLRLAVQMVFQNPYGSLNPRKTVGATLEEPLAINRRGDRAARRDAARAMMDKVGLRQDQYGRYPHMFSGGQRQRIAIARALMLNPRVVVADEPVSALDVSIQAQVLNLMMDLQAEFHLAYLFISHDLSVVRHVARDVMVMYAGRPVEVGPRDAIFGHPRHPYTRVLLAATPSVDPAHRKVVEVVKGELPSPLNLPPGCAFASRCPHARERCRIELPLLRPVGNSRAACHFAEEIG
jgi:dipeptide transport system ATP-binding protein